MAIVDARFATAFRWACLLTIGIYALGLNGPFVFDDGPSLDPVRAWLAGEEAWLETLLGNQSGAIGRPVSMASFMLTSAVGGYNTFSFKLGNLALHVACGLVIWRILIHLLPHDPQLKPYAAPVAAVVAIIWMLHPLHVSTVLNAVQRMTQLSALSILVCVLLYAKGRALLEAGDHRACRWRWFLLFPLVLTTGMLSKENAAIAPLLCLIIEFAWFRRHAQKIPGEVSAFFFTFLLVPLSLLFAILVLAPDRLLASYELRDFTLIERVLTQLRVLCSYVGQILAPRWDAMSLFTDDYPISSGLLKPAGTLASLLALMSISVLAVAVRTRLPILFAGWFFFLLAHAVESTVLPLELYFEHRNYVPSIGLIFAAVGGCALVVLAVFGRSPSRRLALAIIGLISIAILTGSSMARVLVWQSEEQLIAQALRHHPDSTRARLSQATLALRSGDFQAARSAAVALDQSTLARSRLAGSITLLTLDCIENTPRNHARLVKIRSNQIRGISLAETTSLSVLARAQSQFGCGAISSEDIADTIAHLVDGTLGQRATAEPKWRARYIAASLFLRAGSVDRALEQANLAWQPVADVAVGSVLFQIHMRQGDFRAAASILQEMEARIPWYRSTDRSRLESLRKALAANKAAAL